MPGLIGGFLVVLAIGATGAALLKPLTAMGTVIIEYLRGFYVRPTATKDASKNSQKRG